VLETMSASPQQLAQGLHPSVFPAPESDWTIALSITVDADARRISQALTEPEYLEAWIVMPDQSEGSWIVASKKANGYRLDHCCAGCVISSVMGSFLFCHQRKMRLLWQSFGRTDPAESLVDFRIRGKFASSVLELRHTAIRSSNEFHWHQELWRGSLARLASVLRSA
jgi:hypothetical protein